MTDAPQAENQKIAPVFSDERGDIFDLVEEKVGHVGFITFKKGAVRANHYHIQSVQFSYIVSGTIMLRTSATDGSDVREYELTEGTLTRIPPMLVHTYTAQTDATMLDMTTLSRNDDGYEKDTVRIARS